LGVYFCDSLSFLAGFWGLLLKLGTANRRLDPQSRPRKVAELESRTELPQLWCRRRRERRALGTWPASAGSGAPGTETQTLCSAAKRVPTGPALQFPQAVVRSQPPARGKHAAKTEVASILVSSVRESRTLDSSWTQRLLAFLILVLSSLPAVGNLTI
jgi:hypothetical protein